MEGRNVLKEQIISSLENQGFIVVNDEITLPISKDKDRIRELHHMAVQHKISNTHKRLKDKEEKLLQHIASGTEIMPRKIKPYLVEITRRSTEEMLFRYASLHWSIPVSSGYGRRLRFLVMDEQNQKLIGLIGLGDPVFSLKARDSWIDWEMESRKIRLSYLMDAFVLGAVPPYSHLLCGKLIALIAASNEVREAYKRKYGNRVSLIQQKKHDGSLAMLTTTSALGRSSLYNRLNYKDRKVYQRVGFTRGFGEFHFSNGMYEKILDYVRMNCQATAKHEQWGTGFRNRRETIRKCLVSLGISSEWLCHGIQREIFVVPLAYNTREFLQGTDPTLNPYDQSIADTFDWFRDRWLLPRAQKDTRYLGFKSESYQLWS